MKLTPFLLFLLLFFGFSCKQKNPDRLLDEQNYQKVYQEVRQQANRNYAIDEKHIDSAYRKYGNYSSIKSKFDVLHLKSNILNSKYGLYKEALIIADSAINLLQIDTSYYGPELVRIYLIKGNSLVNQYRLDEAIHSFFKAKKINAKYNNFKQSASINTQLANVLYLQKKFKDAIFYYKEAIKNFKRHDLENNANTIENQQRMQNNLGLSFENDNQLDSAVLTYQVAVKTLDLLKPITQKEKDYIVYARAVALGNLGSAYYKLGDYELAEKTFLESLGLAKNDIQDGFFNKIKLAHVYIATKKFEKALPIIKEIKKYLMEDKKPFLQVQLRFNELSWKYYDQTKNIDKAYPYFQKYHHLKDSVDIAQLNLSKLDFNKEFIKLEQQNEINKLKKQDELKSIYLILAIGFAFLFIIIIFLSLKNVRTSRQNVKNLTILNTKISEHNQMMEKTLTALEQSQEENKQMMQVVAHDMRTPIAGVIGLTSLMLEEELSEDHREILTMINTSGNDTLHFMDDLLQAQKNKNSFLKEPVEVESLLKYCITLLDGKAKEKNQNIVSSTFKIEININREKIWRVISNLISNAIKFSAQNEEIAVTMEKTPLTLLIKIKDNGIGIPEDLGHKLFHMDASIQRDGTNGEKSYGLGLAICKQIVDAHDGSLWFESATNKGTTFYLELPIKHN